MSATQPLVLHVIHHLVTGGMENGLVNVINRMSASKYRHAIACVEDFSDYRHRITRSDVEVVALRRSRIGVWRMRGRLFALCKTLRPAIVHSRNQSGLDALLPARLAGVRHCVHGEHGWDVNNLHGNNWRSKANQRLNSPLVSRFVVVSRDIERHLVERIGIAPSRITQIYNGVDTRKFVPTTRPEALAPEGFLSSATFLIGTVGRLQPVKDQATLIRAFAKLAHDAGALRSRLRLAIVGNGPLMQELRNLSNSLGIDELCWFPGDRSDISSILPLFDIFVLSSLNEGISNTVLEAMACGLPVVASRVGGNPEILQESTSAFFFDPGDTAMLATLLQRYAEHPELRRAHGVAARNSALSRFSLDTMVEKYQALYDQLLA